MQKQKKRVWLTQIEQTADPVTPVLILNNPTLGNPMPNALQQLHTLQSFAGY